MSNTQLLEKIDAAIAEKNLLKHPFYQDWQAGKLSRESLQLYAAQYYRHVEAFPRHLRVLAARADESLKPVVLENLAEEENPAAPHPQLWRDFAAALVRLLRKTQEIGIRVPSRRSGGDHSTVRIALERPTASASE